MKIAPDGGGKKMTPAKAARVAAAYQKAKASRPFQNPPVMHLPSGTPGAKPLPGGFFDKPPTSSGAVPASPMSKKQSGDEYKDFLARRNKRWPS